MKKFVKAFIITLAAMFLCSGVFYTNTMDAQAASNGKTTTTTSTKKSTKVVKLKRKAKAKTTKKVKTKKNTKKYTEDNYNVIKVTTVKTTTVTKFAAKKKTIKTTVKTTVKTTKNARSANQDLENASGELHEEASDDEGDISIDSMSGTVSPMIVKAFKELNFKIVMNSNAKYAGLFDARNQQVILKVANKGYLLHELGHFVSFVTGLKDSTPEFISIYKKEAGNYSGSNKAYVTKNNSEYFAESVRDYYSSPSALKSSRPETYNYVKDCISQITDERIDYVNSVYYGQ